MSKTTTQIIARLYEVIDAKQKAINKLKQMLRERDQMITERDETIATLYERRY